MCVRASGSVGVPHPQQVETRALTRRGDGGTCPLQLCLLRHRMHHAPSAQAPPQRLVLARGCAGRYCSSLPRHPPRPGQLATTPVTRPLQTPSHATLPLHTPPCPLTLPVQSPPQHFPPLCPSMRAGERTASKAQPGVAQAGSRKQDAGRKAGASEACEARRHAQGSAIPRTPTCHKALALPRQNVPVTVSTTLRAAEPRGLRGSPCPSACRHSSTRTLSACACTARRVAVMWPLVTCCLRSRAPRAGWHTQEFPLAGVLWRVAVPLPPWSAPLSTVGVACLHARAYWALLVLADKTCKDVWVRQPDGA